MAILALAGGAELQAQVGISSRVSQVALIARVAPSASIRQEGPLVLRGTYGGSKELSVKLQLSANAGYRLVALATAPTSGAPLLVLDALGEYRELTPGIAVTVARDHRGRGEWLGEVRFRSQAAEVDGKALPVRYEIRVDPSI
jgi:hypothetical protein